MDLYDSLAKQAAIQASDENKKYIKLATEYISHGMDEKAIMELLYIDGCDHERASKIASSVQTYVPTDYNENPPESFNDVKGKIKDTILTASIDKIKTYFNKYAKSFNGIENRIMYARDSRSQTIVDEVVKEIKPYINDLVVSKKAIAKDQSVEGPSSEREILEQELFGVWPIHLIQKRAGIDANDAYVLKRTGIKQDKAPDVFFF